MGDFMTTVILAEKPGQGKTYASAFAFSKSNNGYIEVKDPILPNGEAIVTWGIGHLISLEQPSA